MNLDRSKNIGILIGGYSNEYEISITRVRDIFNKGMRMLRLYKRIRFFNYTMNDYTKEKYA